MILYGSLLLGILLVMLGKLNKVFHKQDFNWDQFIRTNIISFLMNIVAGLYLVINQAELIGIITKIFPNSPFFAGGLFAGICGIAGLVIVQFIVDMVTPGKKTYMGLNKG